jgi:hypothetical protein
LDRTKTSTHITEPITPEVRFTVIGVPKLANRPIQAGAAPSSAAMACVRSAPSSHTEPLPTSVKITRTAKNASSGRECSTPATAL